MFICVHQKSLLREIFYFFLNGRSRELDYNIVTIHAIKLDQIVFENCNSTLLNMSYDYNQSKHITHYVKIRCE